MADRATLLAEQNIEAYVSSSESELDIQQLDQTLQHVLAGDLYELATNIRSVSGCTVIHRAARLNHSCLIACILKALNREQKWGLLEKENKWGYTALHNAAFMGHTDAMKSMLEAINVQERCDLLKMQSQSGRTAINGEVFSSYPKSLRCMLLASIPSAQRCDLFGRTAVQCAAIKGHTETLKYMLNTLKPEEQIQLLETQLTHDLTAANLARKYEHYETANLLQHYRTTAEVKMNGKNRYFISFHTVVLVVASNKACQ